MNHQIKTCTVLFTHFDKKQCFNAKRKIIRNKKGDPVKRLTPVKEYVNASFFISFLRDLLPNIIYHRNMLKSYLDIDFADNLTIGVKWEPDSLHWSKKQVTMHSGIVKYEEEKVYHHYFSDTRIHDQVFVRRAVEEMLTVEDLPDIFNNP